MPPPPPLPPIPPDPEPPLEEPGVSAGSRTAGSGDPLAVLVSDAVAGRPLAMERLLMALHPRLAARIERRLPADVRAVCSVEDVVQETYTEAFQDVGRFVVRAGQDAGESFFRWLATIADHQVVDAVRLLRAAKRGGGRQAMGAEGSSVLPLVELLAIDSHTPSRDARGHEFEAAVRTAIAGLYPAYREALELRYLLGLSPGEVAERMGRTEEAVHKLCSRALGALRESMGDATRFLSRE